MDAARVCSWSSGMAFTLALLLAPARASAAGPEDVPLPAPSTAPPPPPPPPARSAAETVLDLVRPYGLFKPTIIASSAAVESFSQPNASAVTAAGNPGLRALARAHVLRALRGAVRRRRAGEEEPHRHLRDRVAAPPLANLGTLALGFGTAAAGDVDEVGGYLSVKEKLTPSHAVYAISGTAKVLNPRSMVPSYAYPAAPAGATAPPEPSTATVAGTGPGIRWNLSARAGYEYRPLPALALEGFALDTSHVLAGVDAARGVHTLRQAYGVETGMVFTF